LGDLGIGGLGDYEFGNSGIGEWRDYEFRNYGLACGMCPLPDKERMEKEA